jgi:hypothetical protein
MRTSALPHCLELLGPVHAYYPFALEDGGELAPMAIELVDRLAILVAPRRFHCMGHGDPRSLRLDSYVHMQLSFVDILMFLFDVFGGMCG